MALRKRMLPVKQEISVKVLPPTPIDDDFSQRLKCAVCYDVLRSPTYQLIPCSHKFCETCIKTWRYTHLNKKCPMCCKPASQITRDHFVETILEKYYAMNPNAPKREACPAWEGSVSESESGSVWSSGDSGLTLSDFEIDVDVVRVTDIPEQARRATGGARRLQTETQRIAAALEELRALTGALERSIDVVAIGAQDEQVRVTVTPERPPNSRPRTQVRRSANMPHLLLPNSPPHPPRSQRIPVRRAPVVRPSTGARQRMTARMGVGFRGPTLSLVRQPPPSNARVPPSRPAQNNPHSATANRPIQTRAATPIWNPIPAPRAAPTRTRPPTPRRVRRTHAQRSRTPAPNRVAAPIPRVRANDQILPQWSRQRAPTPALRRSARIQALAS